MNTLYLRFALLTLLIPGSARTMAQDPPGAAQATLAEAVVNWKERPKVTTETQRLRRTVKVDGTLDDNEWDAFYTVTDGPVKGVIYCNWDDNFLYLAARCEKPSSVVFDLDAGGDGWLRGADNLEIVAGSVTEGRPVGLTARLLDAANSKDTPTWNEKTVDVKSILAAGKVSGGTQFIEIAIPKHTASLVLRPGAGLGLRAEFLPAGESGEYKPSQPFEPHLLLDAVLVDSKTLSAPGINPRLTISDSKCIAGQTLFATLELLNQTDQPVPVRSVTWSGEGASANAVNTLREVTVPAIKAMKTLKVPYKTVLPPGLTPGSYMLTVLAEVGDNRRVQASASFTVVEPLQVQMGSAPDPVAVVGLTKLTVSVDIFSAVPRGTQGEVELRNIPAGWELSGKPRRAFEVGAQDRKTVTRFQFKLPSTTAAGEFPLEATVFWHGRTWQLKHTVRVVRTDK